MCVVRVLVVGDSEWRNLNAIRSLEDNCKAESGGEARLEVETVGPLSTSSFKIDDYDLVAVDDAIMTTDCCKSLIGTDVPVITFSDLNSIERLRPMGATKTISCAITHAVSCGNIRDKIASVMEQIRETSRFLSCCG